MRFSNHVTLLLAFTLSLALGCGDDDTGTDASIDGSLDGTVDQSTDDMSVPDVGSDDATVVDGDAEILDATPDAEPPMPKDAWVLVALQSSNQVASYRMDAQTGVLTLVQNLDVPNGPGPLAMSPNRSRVYAGLGNDTVEALEFDVSTGMLSRGERTDLPARSVYLATDITGDYLLSAYYGANTVQSQEINADGTVKDEFISRLTTQTNPHFIQVHSSNTFALVPNTNSDVIEHYRFDAASGELSLNDTTPNVSQPNRTGARHLTFHPTADIVFVVNEHADSVTSYSHDSEGVLTELNTVTTLPSDFDGEGNTCADIHISPNGRFLYASNRGHNSIAAFEVDAAGAITARGHFATAATPREFDLDPSGRFLFAVGQGDDMLHSYAISDVDGTLTPIEDFEVGGRPSWVLTTLVP